MSEMRSGVGAEGVFWDKDPKSGRPWLQVKSYEDAKRYTFEVLVPKLEGFMKDIEEYLYMPYNQMGTLTWDMLRSALR